MFQENKIECLDPLQRQNDLRIRGVKSFVCRRRPLSRHQQARFASLWSQFGLTYQAHSNAIQEFFDAFPETTPRVLELGFGNGDSLVEFARHRRVACVGVEVYQTGLMHCMQALSDANLRSVKVMQHDGVEVLSNMVPPFSLNRFHAFFPDPWPKKRHHKRRLISQPFLECLKSRLADQATLHIRTDDSSYHEWIQSLFQPYMGQEFVPLEMTGELIDTLLPTKYEQLARSAGRAIFEHHFRFRSR